MSISLEQEIIIRSLIPIEMLSQGPSAHIVADRVHIIPHERTSLTALGTDHCDSRAHRAMDIVGTVVRALGMTHPHFLYIVGMIYDTDRPYEAAEGVSELFHR